jgi:hypothetical protein
VAYTAKVRHTPIDRELYLPRPWTSDAGRCAVAGVPEDTGFTTKPELAEKSPHTHEPSGGGTVRHRSTTIPHTLDGVPCE